MKPWPQLPSDPRLYYFAVPNEIFRSEINASEFSFLAYFIFTTDIFCTGRTVSPTSAGRATEPSARLCACPGTP